MIKIGIAGYGKIGQLRTSILSERDDVTIVGVYDPIKPEKLKSGIFSPRHRCCYSSRT